MGLFDNINCQYPLPDTGKGCEDYQTKDTPCQAMSRYEIREDGTIWAVLGMFKQGDTWSKEDREPEQWMVTGEVRFHDYTDKDEWIEYSAYFVDGKLKELHRIE